MGSSMYDYCSLLFCEVIINSSEDALLYVRNVQESILVLASIVNIFHHFVAWQERLAVDEKRESLFLGELNALPHDLLELKAGEVVWNEEPANNDDYWWVEFNRTYFVLSIFWVILLFLSFSQMTGIFSGYFSRMFADWAARSSISMVRA